jgi:hypothetical protein
MKPLIGVTPDFNAGDRKEWGGREPTYFLRARYIRAIEDLGGIPLVLPLAADLAARRRLLTSIDGLLLTGSGPDLAPELYGERQRYKFRVMSQRRPPSSSRWRSWPGGLICRCWASAEGCRRSTWHSAAACIRTSDRSGLIRFNTANRLRRRGSVIR